MLGGPPGEGAAFDVPESDGAERKDGGGGGGAPPLGTGGA